MVIAKVGDGGQVSIYNNTGSVDVVVDVLGWFPSGSTYNSLVPARLLDTRPATHVGADARSRAYRPTCRSPVCPAAHRRPRQRSS